MAVYPVLPSYDQYCFELGLNLAELDLSTWDDQNATTSDSSSATPPPSISSSDSILAVVSNMPTVAMDDTVCIVCMEGPHDHQADHDETDHHQEVVGKQMPCNHIYHANCLSTWLSRYNSCPLCRCTIDTTIATTSRPEAPSPPAHHDRQSSLLINI
ncbi:hypothetical protein MKW98_006454 [Papaver atlanticum]|uniref:RING-type domain-containing protein n=1 Tax=Papaver atlanticum TaxID=357466 RepID=A0AAD4SGQ4_9MAGN|nr:hypothetical protein MKW98_006454 [Papaver atlanticum]